MQHDSLTTVLDAFGAVDAGPASRDGAGLSVVRLFLPGMAAFVGPAVAVARASGPDDLVWEETDPPLPRRVGLRNPTRGTVGVDAGTVVAAGMSERAVLTSVVVPPGAALRVAVEPVGARWWQEGALRPAGRLPPTGMALLLQAAHGRGALAASARTALWSLRGSGRLDPDAVDGEAPPSGWLLEDARGVVAAWLAERPAVPPRRRIPAWPAGAGDGGHARVTALRTALRRGDVVATVLGHAAGARDLIVLPSDQRLVDAVIAMSVAPTTL